MKSNETSDPNINTFSLPGGITAVYAPAHNMDYPDLVADGVEQIKLSGRPEGIAGAKEYLKALIPETNIELLSDEGSSAAVFEDDKGKIYKVYRDAEYYSYIEEEAAVLKILSDEGVAPKLHALIDAGMEHRLENRPLPARNDLEDVAIPRIDSHSELPVLVMDKVEGMDISEVPSASIQTECFKQVSMAALKHGLCFGDTQILYEPSSKSAKVIDAGGIYVMNVTNQRMLNNIDGTTSDMYPGVSDQDVKTATIMRLVLYHFGVWVDVGNAIDILKESGLDGFTDLLNDSVSKKLAK